MATENAAWTGERVPERAVIDHWLATERRKRAISRAESEESNEGDALGVPDGHGAGLVGERSLGARAPGSTSADAETIVEEIAALSDDEALDAVLRRKPGAAAFLWRARPIEWTRIEVAEAEFGRLRYVGGPDDLGWRALAPGGRVVEGARRIAAGDEAALAVETGVDVERVRGMAGTLAEGDELDALVLTKRRGQGGPAVADGNHRATAIALHALRTGEYRPQRAYLGVGANPVLKPLYQRIRGALSRLRPGGPRW